MSTASPKPTRRTQEERTAETRGKLLDATLQSLLEAGYAATTTRRVAELAGVSQGAQTHHFPRRVDLVVAAVERLTEQRSSALADLVDALPTDQPARTRGVLDLIWRDFSSPIFTVFVKLWVAAAEDPELYERLVPLERRLARQVAGTIPDLVREDARPADLNARVTVVLSTLRGLALSGAFEPTARDPRDPWADVRPVLERVLLSD
ncbi:MAG: TetR/AcrR family transcriptional regulator [Solirubrobacteraceae bacterium]|nr:TetR/AcrR family transcriptional regulator [Solirubrobacteraceae bacterium]